MITNVMDLPQPFVEAAKRKRVVTKGHYSVTTILKGTSEIILSRRHASEIEEDVSDMIWAIFGTAVHRILEDSQETDSQIKEGYLEIPVCEGYVLTGIFDLYDDSTWTVTDYKTAGTIKYQKRDFEDYRKQTLLYCWMLRKLGFNAFRGEIVMMLRDWTKSKAKYDKEYPQTQVQKVTFNFSDEDFTWCENFVKSKFEEIRIAESLHDDELEPCSEEERWHKEDMWAVVKAGNKKAFRVLDCEESANDLAREMSTGGKVYNVEYRPGEDTKCENYCSVRNWCPLWSNCECR